MRVEFNVLVVQEKINGRLDLSESFSCTVELFSLIVMCAVVTTQNFDTAWIE